MQDVPEAVQRKGLTYNCYMNPTRPAILDDTHAFRLNYETYFFADTAAKELFRGDILRFCGLLTDPVSKRRFRPTVDSPRSTDEETRIDYYFESEASQHMFEVDPDSYRLPGYKM